LPVRACVIGLCDDQKDNIAYEFSKQWSKMSSKRHPSSGGEHELRILGSILADPTKLKIVQLLLRDRESDFSTMSKKIGGSKVKIARALTELQRDEILESRFELSNPSRSMNRVVLSHRIKSQYLQTLESTDFSEE
jgi:DNA-binding transcriptional ArsR family regulator